MAGLNIDNLLALKNELSENIRDITVLENVLHTLVLLFGWGHAYTTAVVNWIDVLDMRNDEIISFIQLVDVGL